MLRFHRAASIAYGTRSVRTSPCGAPPRGRFRNSPVIPISQRRSGTCISTPLRSRGRFGYWIPLECSAVLETSLTTSAVSRDTISDQAAEAAVRQSVSVVDVHPSTLGISRITRGVAHHTSLRSQRDHDDSCELPGWGGGSPFHFAGHVPRTISPHRHSRIQASPRRRWQWSTTAEFLVIDLIA